MQRAREFANDPPGDPRGPAEQLVDELADEIEKLQRMVDHLFEVHHCNCELGVAITTAQVLTTEPNKLETFVNALAESLQEAYVAMDEIALPTAVIFAVLSAVENARQKADI